MADTPKGASGTGAPQEPPVNQIVGTNNLGPAVTGTSYGGVGVSGSSLPTVGPAGTEPDLLNPNVTSDGVFGEGKNGVHGVGSLSNPSNWALSNGVLGASQAGIGVHGVNGAGSGTTPKYGCGIWGESDNGYGVYGASKTASAVYGTSGADNLAGEFVGDVSVTGKLTLTGALNAPSATLTGPLNAPSVTLTGALNAESAIFSGAATATDIVITGGADCAEEFDLEDAQLQPGSVVVFTDDGRLAGTTEPYDRRVAGVISGAGAYRPGVILDRQSVSGFRAPVALIGKVFCKVDADFASIDVGDLLTTSPTAGCAMKATDRNKAFGAVIGKALAPHADGRGLIPMLVTLQ